MAVYLKHGFDSANATLTNVFDTVTEDDATTTFRLDATGGTFGLPGASVTWTGSPATADSAYGTVLFNNKGAPFILAQKRNRPTHMRIAFQMAWPTITGLATNDRVKVVQVMCNDAVGAEIELFSVLFVKTASAYKWRIETFDGATTTGSTFTPITFAYSTFQGWCIDVVMKPNCANINIGTVWGWSNQGAAGAHVQHTFTTNSVFGYDSASHIPTKCNIGAISIVDNGGSQKNPTATSEMNLDDISIIDNLMDNPGLLLPFENDRIGRVGPRHSDITCALELDFAQVGLPFQSFAVFGAPPSNNYTLGDTDVTTQIAIDEGAVYMVATTMVESSLPNADNPATRADPEAGKGAFLGRGYTQMYTEKYNAEATSLPSVPYWGMNQLIKPVNYILVPPGHDSLVFYNGEFAEMEVYVHRVRYPY